MTGQCSIENCPRPAAETAFIDGTRGGEFFTLHFCAYHARIRRASTKWERSNQ